MEVPFRGREATRQRARPAKPVAPPQTRYASKSTTLDVSAGKWLTAAMCGVAESSRGETISFRRSDSVECCLPDQSCQDVGARTSDSEETRRRSDHVVTILLRPQCALSQSGLGFRRFHTKSRAGIA